MRTIKINRITGELDSTTNINEFYLPLLVNLLKSGQLRNTNKNLNLCSSMTNDFFIFSSDSTEKIFLDLAYLLDKQNYIPEEPSTKTIWNLNSSKSLGPASRFFPEVVFNARKSSYDDSSGLFDKSNTREVSIKKIFEICKPYHKMVSEKAR